MARNVHSCVVEVFNGGFLRIGVVNHVACDGTREMIMLRRNIERHHVRRGKYESWLTFGSDNAPHALDENFGALTNLREIRLAPRGNIAARPHKDTEIITHVRQGTLAQEDSTGRIELVRAGEFQSMVPDAGVRQYETNASGVDPAHIFRCSLHFPHGERGLAHGRSYFSVAQRHNVLRIVGSPDGRKDSLCLQQDALVYSSLLDEGNHIIHELSPGRRAWLQIIEGEVKLNDVVLTRGDGSGITNEPAVSFTPQERSEILLIELGPLPRERPGVAVPK